MNMKIINQTLLGATCLFLMACGSPKNSGNSTATAEVQENVESTEAVQWRSVYFDWAAGEVYPEDACAEGRVTLTNDGTLVVRDCSETRNARISESELSEFENELEVILNARQNPIKCNGDQIADYAQSWKLVDGSGQTVQIFQFNIENTCGRVANVDQLNDYLYVLKEKYFPRVEEGVYE